MAERFPENVRVALGNRKLRAHLGKVVPALLKIGRTDDWRPEFEELRERARAIRQDAVDHLDRYMAEFLGHVREGGGVIHHAVDGESANRYIVELAKKRGVLSAVKAKSMTTEEIRLNEALLAAGIEPVETDLGQLINQLAGDDPSHMVAPAIHHARADVGALFARTLHSPLSDEPQVLARAARQHLRARFAAAGMGISGVNFAVAETGTVVICENEGNIGLSTTLPRIHVVVMGIEKVIPRLIDLEVFLPLLSRIGGGVRMFRYVSMLTGARGPGGPEELHIVILDNGRSQMARDPLLRESLRCIRCGACQAVCPVYAAVGGHAYGSIYHGPIGAMISPQLGGGLGPADDLPHASTLCGACSDVCPVKIPIPHILLALRQRSSGRASFAERAAMKLWSLVMRHPSLYRAVSRIGSWLHARLAGRALPRWVPLAGAWTAGRALPPPPGKSFHRRWEERERGQR